MTTDSGGWTLIANISDDGDDVWSEFMPASDAGLWDSTDTLGTYSITADYKSAYMDVAGTDILIKEEGTNVFMQSCFTEQSFQSFISGLSWAGTGSDSDWSDATGAHLCDFVHFDYEDTVLRASSHSGSDRFWVSNGEKQMALRTEIKTEQ